MTCKRFGVLAILLILFMQPLSALTVKLGSPFPDGSPWDQTLQQVAAEWSSISNGRVTLRIFPGGIAGDEPDMIRKMRIGQLDAGVFTSSGMKSLVPDTFVLSLPLMLQTEEELDWALENIIPRFDDDFNDAGFEVLSWSKSGWAYIYSRDVVNQPADLMRLRLSVGVSDQELIEVFKISGFNVVPLSVNQLMVSLQNGLVDSFYTAPMGAAVYQWFAIAPEMLNIPFSPVLGGLLISERTWNRIPANLRDELKESINKVAEQFYIESERLNQEAMDVMYDNGLSLNTPNAEDAVLWEEAFERMRDLVVQNGGSISEEFYEDFSSELEEYRTSQ